MWLSVNILKPSKSINSRGLRWKNRRYWLLLVLPTAVSAAPQHYYCTVLEHSALYDRVFVLNRDRPSYQFNDVRDDALQIHLDENQYVETYRSPVAGSRADWYRIYLFDFNSLMLMLAKVEYGPPEEYAESIKLMVANALRMLKHNPRWYKALKSLEDRFREDEVGYQYEDPEVYYHRPDLYRWIPEPLPDGYRRWGWGDSFWQCKPVSTLNYYYLSLKLLLIVIVSSAG